MEAPAVRSVVAVVPAPVRGTKRLGDPFAAVVDLGLLVADGKAHDDLRFIPARWLLHHAGMTFVG